MFGDAFVASFRGNDATMTVTGDTVDGSAVAVAVAVVVTAPSVTNRTIVVLVAHK